MSTIQIPPVEPVSVSLLKVDGQNPNRMTKDQHERLATSIKKYGFIVPLITNRDLLIADGEQRFEVAKSLGMSEVPVIRLDVEDVDRRLLRQVLNKLRGEHELIADALEFEKIIGAGREDDLKHLLDLNDNGLERYIREIHPAKDEDYEIPEIDKVQTDINRGDILQLGKHRLMCGDSTIKEDIAALCTQKVNMIFTDPPYGVGFDKHHLRDDIFKRIHAKTHRTVTGFKNWGEIEGDKTLDTYFRFLDLMAEQNLNISWYLCAPSRYLGQILAYLDSLGVYFATPIVWVKEHWVMSWERYHAQHEQIIFAGDGAHPTGNKSIWYGRHNETTFWQIHRESSLNLKSPTQKPTELVERALLNSSKPDDIVLDGFGGSGSTLIACEQTGRICYMMEIDPRYCQVIVDRWEKYTGQKAVKTGENNVPTNSNREDS